MRYGISMTEAEKNAADEVVKSMKSEGIPVTFSSFATQALRFFREGIKRNGQNFLFDMNRGYGWANPTFPVVKQGSTVERKTKRS